MAAYRFVIKANDLTKVSAAMAFPAEGFEDVDFTMSNVGDHGTYTVTLRSGNERSLNQAVKIFGDFARGQRAVVGEGAIG